jgi:hypothetical protein
MRTLRDIEHAVAVFHGELRALLRDRGVEPWPLPPDSMFPPERDRRFHPVLSPKERERQRRIRASVQLGLDCVYRGPQGGAP